MASIFFFVPFFFFWVYFFPGFILLLFFPELYPGFLSFFFGWCLCNPSFLIFSSVIHPTSSSKGFSLSDAHRVCFDMLLSLNSPWRFVLFLIGLLNRCFLVLSGTVFFPFVRSDLLCLFASVLFLRWKRGGVCGVDWGGCGGLFI